MTELQERHETKKGRLPFVAITLPYHVFLALIEPHTHLLLEIALVEAHETSRVASLVACHLMDAVVQSVEVVGLSQLGSLKLVSCGALLCSHAHLHIGLGVVQDAAAQELSVASGVSSLVHGVALKSAGNLGITLTIGLASHSQIHAHLGTLASEGSAAMLQQLSGNAFLQGNAQLVLGCKLRECILCQLSKLTGGSATDRALLRSGLTLVDVSAYGANKLLLHNVFVFVW